MTLTIEAADAYVLAFTLDNEDWQDADSPRKQALLNVAGRELRRKYPTHTIPDDAAYEFANALAIAFNDQNRLRMQGVKSSSDKVGTVTFDSAGDGDLSRLIPPTAVDLINEDPANATLPKAGRGGARSKAVRF